MLNAESLRAVAEKKQQNGWIKPLYSDYSFSQIPFTIKRLLLGGDGGLSYLATDGKDTYDLVIHLCIDGFGWCFFEKYADTFPFLRHFVEKGVVSKITSQFPSTTVAHMTCLHTGLNVGQSGLYEWFYYEPLVDAVMIPLRFSYAGDSARETLKGVVDPSRLYPFPTIYQTFQRGGVTTHALQDKEYAFSPYSTAMFQGAMMHPFHSAKDGLHKLLALCRECRGKTHLFAYVADIDSAAHHFGPDSERTDLVIRKLLVSLEQFLYQLLQLKVRFALMVTADHGQIAIKPNETVYLNQLHPELQACFKKTKSAKPIVPAGSARDFFLYIEEEVLGEVAVTLKDSLKGVADVVYTQELIHQGYFGPSVTDRLLDRLGNLLLLPHTGKSVWWYEPGRFQNHFFGLHGGLTPQEMETIFLFTAN